MYLLYTNDSILAGLDQSKIDPIIRELKDAVLNITEERDLQDFLGVNIEQQDDGSVLLTQPHLIDSILQDLRMDSSTKTKSTPALSSHILFRHTDSDSFDRSFDYRSVMSKLNYLERASRTDISYRTHQRARFSADPKVEHGKAVRWLGRYLAGTRNKGLILRPEDIKDLEIFVDANFAGNWDRPTQRMIAARLGPGTATLSTTGCPIIWKSQLQTEIALSSTESEYNGLSYALREVIPIMELLKK